MTTHPAGPRGYVFGRLLAALRREIVNPPPVPAEPAAPSPARTPVPVTILSRRTLAMYGPVIPGEDEVLAKLAAATNRRGGDPLTAAREVFGRPPTRGLL